MGRQQLEPVPVAELLREKGVHVVIGAFAALAVIGAVEAHAAARKANARFGLRGEADVPGSGLRIAGPGIAPTSTGVEFHALRIRF